MIYVVVGAAAFPVLCVVDLLCLRERTAAKAAVFCLAAALFLAGIIGCSLSPVGWGVPPALRVAGWAVGALTLALVILSLVVAVPTLYLYLTPARGEKLVTSGLYAMTRHPGVMWFSLFLVSLVLVTGSQWLAVAAPVWITMDILHVAWQERRYLVRVYGEEYRRYQAEVPMLVPTAASIRRGLASLRATK